MKKLTQILVICTLIYGCSSENDFIQNIYVNELIDLNLPENSELVIPGNSIFVDGGGRRDHYLPWIWRRLQGI